MTVLHARAERSGQAKTASGMDAQGGGQGLRPVRPVFTGKFSGVFENEGSLIVSLKRGHRQEMQVTRQSSP